MNRLYIFILSFCLVLSHGCDAATEDRSDIDKSKRIAMSLKEGQLIYNNHPIELPMHIDEITKIIGPYSRFSEMANDIYTWDDNGFILWSEYNKKTVYQIGIYIRKAKPLEPDSFSPSGTRFTDSRPKQDFTGNFVLDNVSITPKLKYESLNAKKSGKKFYRTHWSDTFHYVSGAPSSKKRYEVVVYLHDDKTIEYIELNFHQDPYGTSNPSSQATEPN